MNLIDFMTGQEIMTRLRVRQYNGRMLDPEKVVGQETKIRIVNIGLPILLVVLYGIVRFYLRRRKNLALQSKA
jgi:ABC-2 type transport system permease protein